MITCTCRDLVTNSALAKLPHVAKYVAQKKLDVAVAKYEIKKWSSFKQPKVSASRQLDRLVMVTDQSVTRIPLATAYPFQGQCQV